MIDEKHLEKWIEDRMDGMLKNHKAWGDLESTEVQFLLLMDLRNDFVYDRADRDLFASWSKVLHDNGYRANLALSSQLQDDIEQWEKLSRLLTEFRERNRIKVIE